MTSCIGVAIAKLLIHFQVQNYQFMIKKDSKNFISCLSPKKKLKVNSQNKSKTWHTHVKLYCNKTKQQIGFEKENEMTHNIALLEVKVVFVLSQD